MKRLRLLRRRRGFTLVELMVAIVVAGVVVVSAYALFSNTSRAMYEVDNLSKLNDQARFAAELIARDVRSAGSFSTPNSTSDKYVNPLRTPTGDIDLTVNPLKGDNLLRAIHMNEPQDLRMGPQLLQSGGTILNADTSSDEIILVGAFDYPFTFEISGLVEEGDSEVASAVVRKGPRGTWRFARRDPFDVNSGVLGVLPPGQVQGVIGERKSRLMRAMDRNGYMMFATVEPGADAVTYTDEEFIFNFSTVERFRFRKGNEQRGFEPAASDDEGYEAALLDVYRYRVCISPEDSTNLRLVRERLDPEILIDTSQTYGNEPQCDVLASGILEQHVVAEHVADFQVWFDCTDDNRLVLDGLNRQTGWVTPDALGANDAHNCMSAESIDATNVVRANQARVAHIRLSLHAPIERSDLPNYRFLTSSVPMTTTTNAATTNAIGPLQTFDIDGDPTSAARVVTVQIDVDLPNFASRVNR